MKKDFRKMIIEKGQGLTEYVLILAFIAGIGMMFASGGLKNSLVSTFTETNGILGGLFSKTYSEYFHEWRDWTSQQLSGISNDERLKADQEALALLAREFIGKEADGEDGVEGLIRRLSVNKDGNPQFDNLSNSNYKEVEGKNGWSNTLVPLSYTANGLDESDKAKQYIHLDFNGNADTVKILTKDVESYHGYNSGNPENNGYDSKKAVVGDRIFYSDGMINANGNSAANKMVTLQLHYTNGVVDQVNIQARNMNPAPGDNYGKKNSNKDTYPVVDGLNLNVTKTQINEIK